MVIKKWVIFLCVIVIGLFFFICCLKIGIIDLFEFKILLKWVVINCVECFFFLLRVCM